MTFGKRSKYRFVSHAPDWQTHQAESDRSVPIIPDAGNEEEEFARRLKREKLGSLPVFGFPVKCWLAKSGLRVPEDLSLGYPYGTKGEKKTWLGIVGNLQTVGAVAIDLVVEGLRTNRFGEPFDPKEVLIKGRRSLKI